LQTCIPAAYELPVQAAAEGRHADGAVCARTYNLTRVLNIVDSSLWSVICAMI